MQGNSRLNRRYFFLRRSKWRSSYLFGKVLFGVILLIWLAGPQEFVSTMLDIGRMVVQVQKKYQADADTGKPEKSQEGRNG